jgi:hypothetical protein
MKIPLFKKVLGGVAVLVFPFWSTARQSRQRGTLRGNSVMPRSESLMEDARKQSSNKPKVRAQLSVIRHILISHTDTDSVRE